MAPTVFSNKDPHFHIPILPSTNPKKNHSNCLKNTILILIILLAVPLFPSKAPDFVTESVLTDFWEVIYLLFIGIVVSYGLFGKKSAEKTENLSYETEISSLSTVFEDGFENGYGSDVGNGEKVGSLCCENSKSWFLDIEKCDDVKGLDLNVRSLRKRVVGDGREEVRVGEGKRVCDDAKVVRIRGVVPKNLGKRFEEVSGDSVIPWRSGLVRFEKGEGMSSQSVGGIGFKCRNDKSVEDLTFTSRLKSSKEERKWEFGQSKKDLLVSGGSKNGVRNRLFSIGSGLETKRLDNGDLGEESGVEKGKLGGVESLGFEVKSPTLAKVLSRAKSVRTIKPNRQIMHEKEQIGTTFNKFEGLRVNHGNQEVDGIFRVPKPKPILHDEGKEGNGYGSVTDSEDDKETSLVSDAELGSEVDRKADEFIAKIKAQIRLQKIYSPVNRYGG